MDEQFENKIYAFDALFTTNHIKILKIFMTYSSFETQKSLAPIIKYMELQYTLEYFKKHPYHICTNISSEKEFDMLNFVKEIKCYCSPEERENIKKMENFYQTMNMVKDMEATMSNLQEQTGMNFGDMMNGQSNFEMNDILSSMLTPEQKSMFELFNTMQPDLSAAST